MIHVDIPEHNASIEFPEGTDPAEMERVISQNFPSGRQQFIVNQSENPAAEKKLFEAGASEEVQRFRAGVSGMKRGSRQDVLGIASQSDKKARGEADYIKVNAGNVVKPVPALALAQATQGAGGKIRQVGDVIGADSVSRYGQDLAQEGQAVERQIQEERPLLPGTWANSIRSGMASTYMQGPPMVAGGGLVAAGKKGLGMAASLAPLGAITGGQSYQKYRERGFGVGAASAGSAVDEAIEVGTELLPMKEVLGLATSKAKLGIKQVMGSLIKYGGEEYLGESLATLGQDVTDKYLTDPLLSDEERKQKVEEYFTKVNPSTGNVEAWDNLLETLRTTTAQNVLMMGGGAAANGVANRGRTAAVNEPPLNHESFDETTAMPAPSGPLSAAVNKYTPPANLPVPINTIRVTPQGEALSPEQYSPLATVPGLTPQEVEASRQKINAEGPVQSAAPIPGLTPGTTDELFLDEARGWVRDRVAQGQTQYMRMVGEQPQAYNQRVLSEYRKSQAPIAAPVAPQGPIAADVGGTVRAPALVQPANLQERPDPDQVTIDGVTDADRDNLAIARERARQWIPGTRANGPSNKMDLFPWLNNWGKTTPAEVASSIDAFLAGKKLGTLQKQLVAEAIRGEQERVAQEAMQETPVPTFEPGEEADPELLAKARSYAKDAGYGNIEQFSSEELAGFVRSWEEYLADQQQPAMESAPALDEQAHEAASSPNNDLPEPTPAQIEAGNYKKGHVRLHGLDISIENPAGSVRRGVDPSGKEWETELAHHYGYIKGTIGKDKDHIDVFIGPDQESDQVFVVDQVDPKTGKLDEHKVMLGFPSIDEARLGYLANYDESGPQRIGAISEGSVSEFKEWLKNGNTKKAYAKEGTDEVSQVREESGQGQEEVSDLRTKAEGSVPGSLAGAVGTENNGAKADHIPTSFPSSNPVNAEGPLAAPSPAGEARKERSQDRATSAAPAGNEPAKAEKIEDFGEKIGGARKDVATSGDQKPKKAKSDVPSWRRRYLVTTDALSGKFGIWDNERKRPLVRQRFETEEEASSFLPVAVVAIKHRAYRNEDGTFRISRNVTDRKRVTIKDGFASEQEAMQYLAEHAQEIIETNTTLGEEILAKPENVFREGKPRRDRNVTAQDFTEAFGFRGVEFGNWNNQVERQEVMNHAYDGLKDLAELLDIPAEAISLNGDLALAFGARGQGLVGAKAHYEADYAAINLTKMSGAGSLAHEWFHALDNYFARMDGKAKSQKVTNKRGDLVYPAQGGGKSMASSGFLYARSGVRPEVREAFKALIETMYHKAEQYVEDTERAEKFVGGAARSLENRLRDIREYMARERTYGSKKAPATLQQLERFDTLAMKLTSGEDINTEWRMGIDAKPGVKLSYPGAMGKNRHTNDTIEEMGRLYKEVTGRTGFTAEGKGTLDYLVSTVKDFARRRQLLDDATKKDVKVKKVPTSYRMEAYKIDQGRVGDYWTLEHEMAARAFSAYVEDKVEEQGGRSDFLSYGANNELPGYRLFGVRPFPEGEERAALNGEFDKFFGTLQVKETEKGTALFKRGESEGSVLTDVEFDAVFRRVTAGLTDAERAAWFTVAQTFDELPLSIKAEAKKQGSDGRDISGVFHRGKVYLVRDRLVTEKWLEEVVLHEWHGHAGLKGMFGEDITNAMVDLYHAIGGARMFTIGKKYGINLMKYGHAFAKAGYDARTIKAQHTEEMLAHLTNVYSRGHIAQKVREVIGRIRAWLREHGFLKLAELGETDIAWLLKRARAYAESGAWQKDGGPVFISHDDLLKRLEERGISQEDLKRALEAIPSFAAAWHGSPHSFEKFSTDAIGTGEGAQAYGYGLYFAGKKDVAEWYKDQLSGVRYADHIVYMAKDYLRDQGLNPEEDFGYTDPQDYIKLAISKGFDFDGKVEGRLYKVELAPQEDEYLLWDRPLSDQSDTVKQALANQLEALKEEYSASPSSPLKMTGAEFYRGLSQDGDKATSEYLHSLGVRGIKYLDGTSRNRPLKDIKKAFLSQLPEDAEFSDVTDMIGTGAFTEEQEALLHALEVDDWLGFDYPAQAISAALSNNLSGFEPSKELVDAVADLQKDLTYNYVIFDENDVEVTARFAIQRDLDQVSSQGLLKKIGDFLNPLDYSRFERTAQRHLSEDAKSFLGNMLQTPFWKQIKDPAAIPFYDEFAEREVKRFDFNIRMFGGLVDQEGKKTAMEKLRSVVQWTDKVTRFGKLREDLYEPLTKEEKAAYDVLRFEGDAFSKVYGSLSDALRNPRIKAAGVNERVFTFYRKALEAERDSFEIKLQIVQENMEEAGVDPETIKGHIAEYRAKYADIEGWVHRNHGEGDHVVQVHRIIDRLDFTMDQVQHDGKPTDRIRLAYYPGHALTKTIEDVIEPFGASFMQTQNGALIMLFKEGDGTRALEKLKEIDLNKKPGEFWRVLVYSQFATAAAGAEKLAAKVKADLPAAIPRNFRKGYTFETSWKFADKVQEYEFQALQTSDMELERVLTESLKKARNRGELSDGDYQSVQEAVVQATAETLLGRGAGLYQIRRANYLIEGYETNDAIGKYQDHVNSVAGMLSKARYSLRQYKHLRKVTPKMRPWAFKYVEDSLRNMGRADRLSGDARALASVWYLGFSASWMLVNSTQPYVFGQAELSRYTSDAATKIAKAELDVVRDNLSDEERRIFESEEVLTQERESFQAEMAGQLEGVGGAWSKALHGTARVSLALGQRVEVLNRRTMILAAYRVFRAQGASAGTALSQAMEVNSMVNIDMGRHNLPAWARKPLGRTLYTLQSYIMHALNYLYHRSTSGDTRDQKAILRLLWAMQLLGGLPAGVPGSDELDKLMRKMFGYSPKLAFRGFTKRVARDYGTAGEMLDGFIWHGVPGALKPFGIGFSLTGAVQFRVPIISNIIAGDEVAKTITGPLGGLVQKASMGTRQALRGDYDRAAEYLAPNFMASMLSGYRQATEGVKTSHGKPVFYRGKQLKMNMVEGTMRAVGLQPARTADISETRGIERELSSEWNSKRQDALDEYRIQGSRKGMRRFNRELSVSQAAGLVSPLTSESLNKARGGMNRKATRWEKRFGLD